MEKHPIPPSIRESRVGSRPIRLPFERRKQSGGWAAWIYRHRIGVMVTVVIYLSLAIIFMTYRIIVKPATVAAIEIEFTPEEVRQIEQIIEQQKQIEQMQASTGKMQNKVSDENSKYSSSTRNFRDEQSQKLYQEAQRVADQVNAGRDNYNRAISEIENGSKRPAHNAATTTNQKSGGENRDAFVKGNVAASFNLAGRTAEYLDIPAYKCEGGGQVVVVIAVNQNGRVVSASVDKATSTTERCILDEAIAAAKASRFSASSSAANPQHGTITYTFVPQ